ncbi:zonadhesin-like [Tigriopus californicus]|uniref:zonadhesin-like n=1 Tax=Tigriopus californicus TaxID=6832 RepID=UPI0027DA8C89|nr:zonadhesin-like [Tigriopus californicus]
MKFVQVQCSIILWISLILASCQSQDVTTNAPEEIVEITTNGEINVKLPSLTIQTSSIRVVDDVNVLQVNGIGSVQEVQLESETTETPEDLASTTEGLEIEETTILESSTSEASALATDEEETIRVSDIAPEGVLTTLAPSVPEITSLENVDPVATEKNAHVDEEEELATTVEPLFNGDSTTIEADEGTTSTPVQINAHLNDTANTAHSSTQTEIVEDESLEEAVPEGEPIEDEVSESIEEPSNDLESDDSTSNEEDTIPENLRPKFPAAQPRAIGKIVPSVQDFAERVRNGKQLQEDGTTIQPEIDATTTSTVADQELVVITEQPAEIEIEATTSDPVVIQEELEDVTLSSASNDEEIEVTPSNSESSIEETEEVTQSSSDANDQEVEVTTISIEQSIGEIEEVTQTLNGVTDEELEVTTTNSELSIEESEEISVNSDSPIELTDEVLPSTDASIEEPEVTTTTSEALMELTQATTFRALVDQEVEIPDLVEEGEEVSTEVSDASEPINDEPTIPDAQPIVIEEEEEEEEPSNPSPIEENLRPRITSQPAMIQFFTVGEPFVLICEAESQTGDEVKYSWTRNGHFLRENDPVNQIYRESLTNGNLLFISPKIRDVGTYQCVAETLAGKSFSQASLLMVQREAEAIASRLVDNNEVVLVDTREPRQERVFVVMPEEE